MLHPWHLIVSRHHRRLFIRHWWDLYLQLSNTSEALSSSPVVWPYTHLQWHHGHVVLWSVRFVFFSSASLTSHNLQWNVSVIRTVTAGNFLKTVSKCLKLTVASVWVSHDHETLMLWNERAWNMQEGLEESSVSVSERDMLSGLR